MILSPVLSILAQAMRIGSGVVAGGFASMAIADATAIDPQSSIGASGSGWVALVTLKGITSLVGTVDATALTLQVTDPGYDTSGNPTTVSRTITGVAHVRRQYPNGNSKMISTDGTDVTMLVSLSDWIYSGTSIVSASIGSGFYPSCVASSAPVKLNLSTQGYIKPLFAWVNPQQESAGGTHALEGVAFHRSARAGQQVACIKYNVTDGSTTSADVLVSTTTDSVRVTQGNIPEVWAGTVPMSAMTQGVICTANAKVYPWIGNSGAVLDTSVDGTAWPTSRNITPLRVFCDRTGAYGGGYAYVSVGASGGAVSATPATAKASPYPTITAALTGLRAWNNTNKSHNDFGGGFVRLMDNGFGVAQLHTIATAPADAPGSTWVTIERDPDTAAFVSVTWSAQSAFPSLVKWKNVAIVPSTTTYNVLGPNTTTGMLLMDGCTIDNTANRTVVGWYTYKYFYNLTLTGGVTINLSGLPAANDGIAIFAGIVGTKTSALTNVQPSLYIGCVLPGNNTSWSTSTQGNHGRIVYNNRLRQGGVVGTSATTLLEGFANVQNQYEFDATGGSVTCMNYFSDGDLTTVSNYIEMHNTAVGERSSRMYNDVAGTKVIPNGMVKLGVSLYSVWDNYNIKGDTFSGGVGSVGSWAYSYSVGNVGNVSLFGQVNRVATTAPTNDNSDNYLGNAWQASSEYNLYRTALGFTQAQIADMFTNYTVFPRAVPTEGGNYVPLSTATHIKNRVPVGFSVLKKDLDGTTRRTDGTGAAGAYEYA